MDFASTSGNAISGARRVTERSPRRLRTPVISHLRRPDGSSKYQYQELWIDKHGAGRRCGLFHCQLFACERERTSVPPRLLCGQWPLLRCRTPLRCRVSPRQRCRSLLHAHHRPLRRSVPPMCACKSPLHGRARPLQCRRRPWFDRRRPMYRRGLSIFPCSTPMFSSRSPLRSIGTASRLATSRSQVRQRRSQLLLSASRSVQRPSRWQQCRFHSRRPPLRFRRTPSQCDRAHLRRPQPPLRSLRSRSRSLRLPLFQVGAFLPPSSSTPASADVRFQICAPDRCEKMVFQQVSGSRSRRRGPSSRTASPRYPAGRSTGRK